MQRLTRLAFVAAAVFAGAAGAQAGCVDKAGMGTGGDNESAKAQAYEAVLQATDWGMWSQWMVAGQHFGSAPGYKVSQIKTKCGAGGALGHQCTVQARLCK